MFTENENLAKLNKAIDACLDDLVSTLRKAEDDEEKGKGKAMDAPEDEKKGKNMDYDEDESKGKGKSGKADEDDEDGKADDDDEDEKDMKGKGSHGKGKGKSGSTGEDPSSAEVSEDASIRADAEDAAGKEYYSDAEVPAAEKSLSKQDRLALRKGRALMDTERKDAAQFPSNIVKSIQKLTESNQKLVDEVARLKKSRAGVRKSISRDVDVIEKSAGSDREGVDVTHMQILDVMNDMVAKGQLDDTHVCEMNATGNISDRMAKSQVAAEVRKRWK